MNIEKIVNFNIRTLRHELLIARIVFFIAALITPLAAGVYLFEHSEFLNSVNLIRLGAAYIFCLFFLHLNMVDKSNALRIRDDIDSGRLKAFTYMPSGRFAKPEIHLIEVNNKIVDTITTENEQVRFWKEMGISPEFGFNGHEDNKEIVMPMIKRHGHALRHASLRLQNDKELVIMAINDWPAAYIYATPEMKDCAEVALALYMRNRSNFFEYASQRIKDLVGSEDPIKILTRAINAEKLHEKLEEQLHLKPEVLKTKKMKI